MERDGDGGRFCGKGWGRGKAGDGSQLPLSPQDISVLHSLCPLTTITVEMNVGSSGISFSRLQSEHTGGNDCITMFQGWDSILLTPDTCKRGYPMHNSMPIAGKGPTLAPAAVVLCGCCLLCLL